MTTFNGRRAPNLTQYLREDLNVIPGPEPSPEDLFALDHDLALFTTTEFYDLDSGQNTDFQRSDVKPEPAESAATTTTSDNLDEFTSLDFMTGDFAFPDYAAFTSPTIPPFSDSLVNLQPIQPSPQNQYPAGRHYQPGAFIDHAAAPLSDGQRSDASGARSEANGDDGNRVAAEEDKRRRNTAASARFRVKKKQREQALEKSAKEMTEKVTALEGRIQQLETENKWLKNLIMEKNDSEKDTAALWKDRKAEDGKKDGAKSTSAKGSSSRSSSNASESSRSSS